MDEKLCEANRKQIVDRIDSICLTLERQGLDMVEMKLDIAGQAKDIMHFQNAIIALQISIEKLIEAIDGMKYKPVKNYEKAVWIVLTAIITMVLTRAGIK